MFSLFYHVEHLCYMHLMGNRIIKYTNVPPYEHQRPKNPYSKLALLSGKFLRVRKIFARMMKKLFWTAQFAWFVWLTKIGLTRSGIPQHLQLYNVETVLKSLKLSWRFWNCPDDFRTVQTVLKLSGRFQNCPDDFKTVRTISELSGQFQNCPDSFKTVWTISKLFGRFQNCPDSFKTSLRASLFCVFIHFTA